MNNIEDAYLGCYDFNDFITRCKERDVALSIDELREWYDEECARLR